MTSNEPDAVTWQRLFASLVGDAAVDAATIREFCSIHGLTPDRVLSEMQTRRQLVQPQQQVTPAASAGLLGGGGGVVANLKIFADRGSAEIKELLDKTAHKTGSSP